MAGKYTVDEEGNATTESHGLMYFAKGIHGVIGRKETLKVKEK